MRRHLAEDERLVHGEALLGAEGAPLAPADDADVAQEFVQRRQHVVAQVAADPFLQHQLRELGLEAQRVVVLRPVDKVRRRKACPMQRSMRSKSSKEQDPSTGRRNERIQAGWLG